MGMGFRASTTINCTPDLVWAVMTDWSKAPYWLGVDKLRPKNPKRAVGKGSVLVYSARGTQTSKILRWEPNQALTLESVQAGVCAVYEYTLTAAGQGTVVELSANCSATNSIWSILLPLINFMMAKADKRQMPALKRLVEVTVAAAERKADELERQV